MKSLEFIKQHVTEWYGNEYVNTSLSPDGKVFFRHGRRQAPSHIVDLSEHFAPDYYDGKVYTREEFESFGVVEYRYNDSLPNPLQKYDCGEYYYYLKQHGEWRKYGMMLMGSWEIATRISTDEAERIIHRVEDSEPNWNNAPDWAMCYGLIGSQGDKVWYDSERYEYVRERGEEFSFALDGTFSYHEVTHISDRPSVTPTTAPEQPTVTVSSNKYEREISDRQGNFAVVDVYDVLKAFDVTCPATQHALKKLLCTGIRGHKDTDTDLIEARESITRAIELRG